MRMKTSPRIQRGPFGAGISIPMRPRMQLEPEACKVRSLFVNAKDLPPRVNDKSGMSALQFTCHSLPMTDVAPSLFAILVISSLGPAKSVVPESTMAFLHEDMELPPRLTPWSSTSQYVLELRGT